jgi:hypothetical protein
MKITADTFHTMVEENPSVFEHWDTPLEISGFVNCEGSPITHLSPHLIFSGTPDGEAANFAKCPNLKIATGTFQGWTNFGESGVEEIKDLHITYTHLGTMAAATFAGCKSLKIATGTYAGGVTFYESGIHSIHNLDIQAPNVNGFYTDFTDCPNLHSLKGWDLSKKFTIEPEKLAAEKERLALLKHKKENQLIELPFL